MNRRTLIAGAVALPIATLVKDVPVAEAERQMVPFFFPHYTPEQITEQVASRGVWYIGRNNNRTLYINGENVYQENDYGSVRWKETDTHLLRMFIRDIEDWSFMAARLNAPRAIVFLRPDLCDQFQITKIQTRLCTFAITHDVSWEVTGIDSSHQPLWSIYNADEPWWSASIKDPTSYFTGAVI